MIGNKGPDKITDKKVSKNSQQNTSETVTNENEKEIPKEKYISPEVNQEIINHVRLKQQYNNEIFNNITPNQPIN